MYNAINTRAKVIKGKDPAAIAATATSAAIDCSTLDSATFVVQIGAVTGTLPTYDFKVQECDTSGGTYTDIAGAAHTQRTASDANSVLPCLTVKPAKRYVKFVETLDGTNPSFTRSILILGNSDKCPANSGDIFAESTASV